MRHGTLPAGTLRPLCLTPVIVSILLACSAGGGAGKVGDGVGAGTGGGGGTTLFPGSGGGTSVLPGTGGGTPIELGTGGGGTDAGGGPPPDPTTKVVIDDCAKDAAGLTPEQLTALSSGGGGAGALRLLYPYDGTVFPRGLLAPLLMWDGADADVVYVHLQSSSFEYRGCLSPTAPGQLQLDQAIWEQATARAGGAADPYTLELGVVSGGSVVGLAAERVIVSPATLKGSIFYNSYSSALAAQAGGFGGAVLRISPGRNAEVFLGQTGCTGCHSVSGNGARLITDAMLAGGTSYAITPSSPVNPPALAGSLPGGGTFVGMHPDGALYVTNAHPSGMGTRSTGPADPASGLFETDTGAAVANSGIPTGAMTPMFSPDGTLLAFNDYAISNGHGLAMMTFDSVSRTASGYRKIFETTDTARYPGWPFFLPDARAVVFALGSAPDFSGMGAGLLPIPGVGPTSDLFVVDTTSGEVHVLAQAMGYRTEQDAASNATYLPFGVEELHQNFYPTVSPVAAGGYFWIFFDAVRHYGNRGLTRQLWGTAVDISTDGSYRVDPSHPAFYLTGQEFGTGNHRAFTALDPCRADGADCATGIDCCGGYCTDGKCGVPAAPRCSNTDEACTDSSSCCNPSDRCISGFCGQMTIR